jgi:hypothetical protein
MRSAPHRAASVVARSIGAAALTLWLGGCRCDDATGRVGEPIVEPPRGIIAAPEPPYAPPAPSGDVLGHVRIADPFALVAKASGQLAPPGQDGRITIDALRRAAQQGADGAIGKAIAQHFDPGRVTGCALLDPTTHAIPIACVFGFTRGLDQLVEDLGPQGRTPAAGPGTARYEVDGLAVHLHALGPDVVVAFDDTAFAQSRDYLQALTARGGEWDVEVTLHARAAVDRLRPTLDAVGGDLVDRARALTDDPVALAVVQAAAPSLAALAPIASDDGERVLAELQEVGAEVDLLRIGARLQDDGFLLALHASPTAGSELATAIARGGSLPVELLDAIPRHTWLLWLQRIALREVLPATRAFAGRAIAALVADAIGLPVAGVHDLLVGLEPLEAVDEGTARALALFNGPGTWGGAVLLRTQAEGADGREAWRRSIDTLTADALFGAEAADELGKIVTWRFAPEAWAIDGVPVDRFAVEPAPRFEKKLADTLRDDELAAQLVAWIGAKPALFTVDRFEAGPAAAIVLAPGGSEAYARRVAATSAAEHRAPRAELDVLLAQRAGARFVLALSLLDLAEFLHAALPADLLDGLPKGSGRGLGDLAVVGRVDEAGGFEVELRVSQAVIDVARRAFAARAPGR